MRLIDADKLKAEFTGNFTEMYSCTAVKAMIDTEPTVNAVEVVKCSDCKHSEVFMSSVLTCNNSRSKCFMRSIVRDDFCKYGERIINDD